MCHIEEEPFLWRQRDVYAILMAKRKGPQKLTKNRSITRTKQAININNKERTKAFGSPLPKRKANERNKKRQKARKKNRRPKKCVKLLTENI